MLFSGASAKVYESPLCEGGVYLRSCAEEMPGSKYQLVPLG